MSAKKACALKASVILGTRPEIIKMAPVIRVLEARGIDHFILHTGQHYSYNMDRIFFEQLSLPLPKYNLNVGSGTHGEETGKMLIGIENILLEEKPDLVFVEGDTNTVLAGALAAAKLRIKVGHVEAGLRSRDMSMPEEINRIITDHISNYLFAPTEASKNNLLREGLDASKISVTGNTIVDAIQQHLKLTQSQCNDGMAGLGVGIGVGASIGNYFLVTMHRQENVDDPEKLKRIMDGLGEVSARFGKAIIYPIHPRTRKRLKEFGIATGGSIKLIDPVDYLAFLRLESQADLILTDSGGVQEEACILGVPCVTLRENTERPETLDVGANALAGTDPGRIMEKAEEMLAKRGGWRNPFGDGKAAERIVGIVAGTPSA